MLWNNRDMAVGWVVVRCGRPTPPFGTLLFLDIIETFLLRLLYCFWNNYRWISITKRYTNVKNRSKNIKCFQFCVKTLYCECLELAKNLWFCWILFTDFLKEISPNQKIFDITKLLSARQFLRFPQSYPSWVPNL